MVRFWARRTRDESGVVAILVALLSVVLLMFAAYAVDIGLQINRKHQLADTLDAAAQAGAYELPGSATDAKTQALRFAEAHDPTEKGALAPNVDFWCVVASKLTGGAYQVDSTQIPSTCYPGTSPYTAGIAYKSTGRKVSCSPVLCAIPCLEPTPNNGTPKVACNTIRVYQGRVVDFAFAPAGGIQQGGTGNLVSVACKGSCGTIAPNPLDVAVVADRTISMGDPDILKLRDGINDMLKQMTPTQQYVSLGTIGRSDRINSSQNASCNSGSKGSTWPSDVGNAGSWMPVSFSNDYVDGGQNLNTGSALVTGVNCLTHKSDMYQGTTLAAPMKAAARYLLDPSSTAGMPARSDAPSKLLIFETDGQPNERQPTSGTTSLTVPGDIFSHPLSTDAGVTSSQGDTSGTPTVNNTTRTATTLVTHNKTVTYTFNGGANACQNLIDVAANAKAAGITVIMIGYNMFENSKSKTCGDYDGVKDDYSNMGDNVNYTGTATTVANPTERKTVACPGYPGWTCVYNYQTKTTPKYQKSAVSTPVLSVMAQAASPTAGENPVPSMAQNDCSDSAERAIENADGDYLFCAASGTDMAPIFKTALSQASKGIKLMKMP
jgi:hypothetical protein